MKDAVRVSRELCFNAEMAHRQEVVQHFWVDSKEYLLLHLGA